MRESGVDLGTIGLFALVGTPYTIKFLWAPLVDALDVPVLSRLLGRRRGWLVFSQFAADRGDRAARRCATRRARPAAGRFAALLVADRFRDAGHRHRRVPRREPAGERAGRRHGVLCRRLPHRHAGLDRRRAVSRQRHSRRCGFGRGAAWTAGYLAMAALVLIGIVTALARDRAGEARRAVEAERTPRAKAAHARVSKPRVGAFADFLGCATWRFVVLAFVVLFKFTDALAGAMTGAVRDRPRLHAQRLCHDHQGRRLGRDAARRLCRRLSSRAPCRCATQPVDRRRSASGGQSRVLLAGAASATISRWLTVRHHGREFHQRDRHRDLRRLSLGALPQSAAHGDAIRAADRALRGRPHLSVGRRRLSSPRRPAGCGSSRSARSPAFPGCLLLGWLQSARAFRGVEQEA